MSMFGTDEQRKWVLEKLGDSAKLASEKLGEAQVLASQAIADAKLSERAATLAGTASEAIANAKLSERAATAAGSASEMLANAKLGERAATLAAGVNHLVTPLAKRLGADEVLASVRKQGADILTAYARALSEALGLHGVSARITYYATPTTPPLSKAGVSAGGVAATVVVTDALAESAKFAELAALEAAKGQRLVAERLIAGFALAAANPTAQEVKVSLTSTLDKLAAALPKPAAPAKATQRTLSKALVLQKDDAADRALAAALGGDAAFRALARREAGALAARWHAARRVAGSFKLASANPPPSECIVSLESTAARLAAEDKLPAPPAKLSKPLIKQGGKPAVAAVVSLFAKHEGFHALARDAVAAEAAEAARWHQQWYREPLQAAAERRAARVLADNFKLAAHSPSDDEVRVSLNATLSKLTQL